MFLDVVKCFLGSKVIYGWESLVEMINSYGKNVVLLIYDRKNSKIKIC